MGCVNAAKGALAIACDNNVLNSKMRTTTSEKNKLFQRFYSFIDLFTALSDDSNGSRIIVGK